MSGITTSEITSGEPPKEDDLGSRLDELKAELKAEFEKQIFEEVFVISGKLDELSTRLEEIERSIDYKDRCDRLEKLEKKINDGR